jgi:[CysO sulfur-carrier protein]-S-L-cysteine hydrolase
VAAANGLEPQDSSGRDRPVARGLVPGPDADAWLAAAESGRTQPRPGGGSRAWTPASASMPGHLVDQIVAWARQGVPNEACALLSADRPAEDGGTPTTFIPIRNAAGSPYRYLMDPGEQLRAMLEIDDRDEVVWGIVHSHVASRAEPSATDIGLAAYPDALYVICSLATEPPDVRAWRIQAGDVIEVVLQPT